MTDKFFISSRDVPQLTEGERLSARVPTPQKGCAALSIALFLGFVGAIGLTQEILFPSAFDRLTAPGLILFLSIYPVCALFAFGTAHAVASSYVSWMTRRNLERLAAQHRRSVRQEATYLTQKAKGMLDDLARLAERLPSLATTTRELLAKAEVEYSDSAFGPFWDAIENAAVALHDFHRGVTEIDRISAAYYEVLRGRCHTFPPLPIHSQPLPEIRSALEDYRRLLRLGQTNFQFALIWEQRKTRETIIAGFRTLGEAMESVTFGVQEAVDQLEHSLALRLDHVIDVEISTGETLEDELAEHGKMLDNIQRGKVPPGF